MDAREGWIGTRRISSKAGSTNRDQVSRAGKILKARDSCFAWQRQGNFFGENAYKREIQCTECLQQEINTEKRSSASEVLLSQPLQGRGRPAAFLYFGSRSRTGGISGLRRKPREFEGADKVFFGGDPVGFASFR